MAPYFDILSYSQKNFNYTIYLKVEFLLTLLINNFNVLNCKI